jgi:hypothetical protein
MMMSEYNNSPRHQDSKLISIQYNEPNQVLHRTTPVPPLKMIPNPNSKTGLLTGSDRIFPLERIELAEITLQNNLTH